MSCVAPSRRTVIGALCVDACACESRAAAGAPLLKGVNIAGLEFNPGQLPGRVDTDYVAPAAAEIAHYRSLGASIIRVPFLWERLQPDLNAPFDAAHFALIEATLAAAGDMHVILEAHQFGRRRIGGQERIIGETREVTDAQFAAFWEELANRLKQRRNVLFGIQNEPHDQDSAVLVRVQNAAIAAIRETGARNTILVSGNDWSGAHSWANGSNAHAMLNIRDPDGNMHFDVHQYLDRRSSGSEARCEPGSGNRLQRFTQWARRNGKTAFLGEFAAGPSRTCLAELETMLGFVEDNADVWRGWTFWGGGAWWPEDYPFILRPARTERPQMAVLRRFFH